MSQKSPVTYEKRLRDQAISEKKRLITIDYDGRAIGAGRVTVQFVENPTRIKAVENALQIIFGETTKQPPEGDSKDE